MPNPNISEIVPEPVKVEEPKVSEIHEPLGGSEAMAGSPAGSEAKPKLVHSGFKMPGAR